jgi:hypothetical protein
MPWFSVFSSPVKDIHRCRRSPEPAITFWGRSPDSAL